MTLPQFLKKVIVLGGNKTDSASDTLSVILTAKTLKLFEARKWLL